MHKLAPPFRTPPPPHVEDQGDAITVEMALDQDSRATELATDLAGALDEARELLIQVLAIEPHELETPIRKELKDVEQARKLDRQTLEQKYALVRMTARLSIRKERDLAGKVEALEHRQRKEA